MSAVAQGGSLDSGRLSQRDLVVQVVATSVFVATLLVIGTSLAVWGGLGFPRMPMSFVRGPLGVLEISAIALVYTSIGAFMLGRVPGYVVGWSLIAIGVGVALHLPVNIMVGQATQVFHPVPYALLLFTWGLTSLLVPMAAAAIAMIVMVLPDGRLPSSRWRLVMAATLSGFVLLTIGSALTPSGLIWFPTLPNPVPVPKTADAIATRILGAWLPRIRVRGNRSGRCRNARTKITRLSVSDKRYQ